MCNTVTKIEKHHEHMFQIKTFSILLISKSNADDLSIETLIFKEDSN